jgi:hypothetical protein
VRQKSSFPYSLFLRLRCNCKLELRSHPIIHFFFFLFNSQHIICLWYVFSLFIISFHFCALYCVSQLMDTIYYTIHYILWFGCMYVDIIIYSLHMCFLLLCMYQFYMMWVDQGFIYDILQLVLADSNYSNSKLNFKCLIELCLIQTSLRTV